MLSDDENIIINEYITETIENLTLKLTEMYEFEAVMQEIVQNKIQMFYNMLIIAAMQYYQEAMAIGWTCGETMYYIHGKLYDLFDEISSDISEK